MVKRFGNTNFDLDYCKQFSPSQLRNIYNGDISKDTELLIEEIYTDEQEDLEQESKLPTIDELQNDLEKEIELENSDKLLDVDKKEIAEESVEEIKEVQVIEDIPEVAEEVKKEKKTK